MNRTALPTGRSSRQAGLRGRTTAASMLALVLLAGCDSASDDGTPASSDTGSATSESPSPGGSAPAAESECPDAASLYALAPDRQTDVRLTDTTCSGAWAFIGVSGPANAQDVLLYERVDGAWQPADESEACAAGDSLPAVVSRSVCDAG